MSSATVRIHPAALREAEAATEWYRRRSIRAAAMFLDEIDRAIERIAGHSEHSPEYPFGTSRVVLQRFPCLVVFRKTTADMEIIAVAHGRRRPVYWRDRVE